MVDIIKRQAITLGRDSRLDVTGGKETALRQQGNMGNALFELGKGVQRNATNNKNAAWNTYLQTRAVKLKSEIGPALASQSDFAGIDAVYKNFEEWDKNTRKTIMGDSASADEYWNMNGNSTLLTEQTAILTNAAKLNLTNAQAARETDSLIKATAENYALTKNKDTRAQIDAGFLKAIEETQTYSDNGLVMRARTPEEVNTIYDGYKKIRDTKINESTYLNALNMAQKNPYELNKNILNPQEWEDLTNSQREHLFAVSQNQIEARNGTFLKNNVQKFNDLYGRISELAPETARTLLNDMLKNPSTRDTNADLTKLLGEDNAKELIKQIKNLDKNDFDKVLNGWETIAGSPDSVIGLQQLSAMGQIEVENRNLGYKSKDGEIELMDKAASAAIDTDGLLTKLDNIQNDYTALTNRKLKSSANKVIENFKSHLGASVKKDTSATEERGFWAGMILPGESRGDKLYSDSDDYIKNVLVNNYPSLSDAEIGEAYYRWRKNAEKNNFDFNDNSTAAKAVSLKLLNNIMAQNLGVKYNAPADVQNIVAAGAVMRLNPVGKNTAGTPQRGSNYTDFKTIDGIERLVEYDNKGNMVKVYDAERY